MPKGVHNSKRGPKTQFHPTFTATAYECCLLGLTDERIAELLHVSTAVLNKWRKQQPGFARAFERGRDLADAKIAKALYQRALGYSHKAEKISFGKDGEVLRAAYTMHYPPDAACLAFYLSNRTRALWRTKPVGDMDLAAGLEQLILAAAERRAKREPQTIEHQPTDESESG